MSRLRTTIAAIVAAWLVFGAAGVHCAIPGADEGVNFPAQQSREFVTSLVTAVGHVQLSDGSTSPCSAKFATAVVPRPAIALVAVGVVAVAFVIAGWLAHPGAAGGRSPPAGPGFIDSGRNLLTRFCLARR